MVWVLFLCALTSARAQEPSAPSPPPLAEPVEVPPTEPPLVQAAPEEPPAPLHPVTSPFAEVLEEAKREYFAGHPNQALPLFETLQRRIAFGEPIAPDLGADALVYLGELHLSRGRINEARQTFREAVLLAPDYRVNPYHHPVEVGYYYERVRDEVAAERAAQVDPPAQPRPPLPLWGYLPFGAPQFAQRQPVRGAVYGGLQLGFGAASIAVMYQLRDENGTWWAPREWAEDDYVAGWRGVQLRRWAIQVPVTIGFYAVWAGSVSDGRATWRSAPLPTVGSTPSGRGPQLSVTWRL